MLLQIYFETISIFLSHPFTLAIVVFLLGNIIVSRIIPGKKEEAIQKLVVIINLIKEVNFVHDRIVYTEKTFKPTDISIFSKEIDRLSTLLNEKIPLASYDLETEIEVYFNDKNLTKIHNRYKIELKKIHDFFIQLPNSTELFNKKIEEIKELDFKNLINETNNLIDGIRKAKSILIYNK